MFYFKIILKTIKPSNVFGIVGVFSSLNVIPKKVWPHVFQIISKPNTHNACIVSLASSDIDLVTGWSSSIRCKCYLGRWAVNNLQKNVPKKHPQ